VSKLAIGVFVAASLAWISPAAKAQQQPVPPQATGAPAQNLLKAEELDQLAAPIALYPDTLLAEILMASTYPLEVVQADRWANDNKALKGGSAEGCRGPAGLG
jgi:hypothetical protein